MTRLLIDTDIAGATVGGDVDAGLALIAALRHEGVRLEGVIVTGGDLGVKAAQVRRIFELTGRSVPIGLGARKTLLGGLARDDSARPATAGFLSKSRSVHGLPTSVDLLSEATLGQGDLTVVLLGPATNLALALVLRPSLAERIGRVVVSAGPAEPMACSGSATSDPHALALVLRELPGKLTLVGRALADRVRFTAAEWDRIDIGRGPLPEFVAEYVEAWLGYHRKSHFSAQDSLSLLCAAGGDLVSTEERLVSMDPCNRSWPGLLLTQPLPELARHEEPEPGVRARVAVEVKATECRAELARLWDVAEALGA